MGRTTESRPKWWNLEQWSLRWKVTAVVAVPLAAAMILGAIRVVSDFDEAAELQTAADRVAAVPLIVDLSVAVTVLAGQQTVGQAPPERITELQDAIGRTNEALAEDNLDSDVADALRAMVGAGDRLVELGKGSPLQIPKIQAARDDSSVAAVQAVEQIVEPIQDADVIAAKAKLLDSWAAGRKLFEWTIAGARALINSADVGLGVAAASGGVYTTLDTLDNSYPEAADRIAKLRANADVADAAVAEFRTTRDAAAATAKLTPVLLDSREIYVGMYKESAAEISSIVNDRAEAARSATIRNGIIVLAFLLAALVLAVLVARSLIVPIRRLRTGTLKVAHSDLANEIDRINTGEHIDDIAVEPVPVRTTEEIGQLARAVDDMHNQALRLAGEQARLRLQVNDMFETMARRSKSLIDRQLGMIEALEYDEKDPSRLDSLFRLDHLAARMRRNSDNLLVLAGTRTRKTETGTVQLGDILRASMSEVEDYQRVKLGAAPDGAVSAAAATDIVHLFAELLENALRASPPEQDVVLGYGRSVDGGLLVEIADHGIGIPPDKLAAINERLASAATVTVETTRRMGLFVVGRLAERYGVTVRLRATEEGERNAGVTASVHLPSALVAPAPSSIRQPAGRRDDRPVQSANPVGELQQPAQEGMSTGLPRRTPGSTALPSGPPHPAAQPQRDAPQRELPQQPLPTRSQPSGLPQRGAPGLPTRRPAGDNPPAPSPAFGAEPAARPQQPTSPSLPTRRPSAVPPPIAAEPTAAPLPVRGEQQVRPEQPVRAEQSSPPVSYDTGSHRSQEPAEPAETAESERRHRYRSARTASFFQSRLEESQQAPEADTPIFADMVSAWLTESNAPEWSAPRDWNSPADEGWSAADRAVAAGVESRTDSGLPMRQPGDRLVPGALSSAAGKPRRRARDPETVRESLNRHQRGVRDGRAVRTTNTDRTEGER